MADKTKPTLRSMSNIVNFMLESDDEIDLGEHSSDESNVESDWEYEEEHFQPQNLQIPLHLLVIPLRAMLSWTTAELMIYLL